MLCKLLPAIVFCLVYYKISGTQMGYQSSYLKGRHASQHVPFLLRAGVLSYILAKIVAWISSLLCSAQIQYSNHSAQFLLYLLIQERRSSHRAGICLRWQMKANSPSSCNLLTQHKNSQFNLRCHEFFKHTVVIRVSGGRGCSNIYYRSSATREKETNFQSHLD